MARRESKVLLTLAGVREAFEQQTPLAVKDALGLIHEAQRLLSLEPNMVTVRARTSTYVFGDIHGQFFDLMQLVDAVGVDSLTDQDVQLIFLGDYVDRGAFSCEVMLYLLLLKVRFGDKVVLLRGNHECESISSFYGFRNECRVKYGISAYYHFLSCFQAMPIAALLQTPQGNVFCVHGGISPELPSLEAIQAIDRRREIPTEGPLCDLLWADPATEEPQAEETVETQATWLANQVRGCSYYFNAPATFEFLETNDLLSVVRAHECEDEGYMFHFNSEGFEKLDKRVDRTMPPLITVFSAPNYCDSYGNVAGYLVLRKEPFSWEVQQVKAVGHPVPPIASAERGSDMWRQFNQTLPFLPASKEFFEEILWLAEKQRGLKGDVDASKPSIAHVGARDMSAPLDAETEDPTERRRRMTSEMHPQAIRRVLDEEVHKWVQVEEEQGQTATSEAAPRIQRRPSLPKVEEAQIDDRSDLLSTQELDMMKLMFSLMDTDGSMTLSSTKVSQFIFNILGERISSEAAEKYLAALDFDQNGVVDFADILSWAAVMKANHDSCDAGGVLSWTGLRTGLRFLMREIDFRKVCLWLALGCLLRDLFVPKPRRMIKSSSVRLLGSISLALYTMDLLSGGDAGRGQLWARFSPLRHAIAIISRRFTPK